MVHKSVKSNKNLDLSRQMIKSAVSCPYKCQYCFAKWDKHANSLTTFALKNDTIVYPFCDSELFIQDYFKVLSDMVNKSIRNNKRLIISISTKSNLAPDILSFLKQIDDKLKTNNGFIKFGVSITNKSLQNIEEGAATYSERINLLQTASNMGFHTSVVLKPILPFIPIQEYISIIDDTAEYECKYLIGGLYVNSEDAFYQKYIKGKYNTENRVVSWLKNEVWMYVESLEMQNNIREHIFSCGSAVFDSDKELIESWVQP